MRLFMGAYVLHQAQQILVRRLRRTQNMPDHYRVTGTGGFNVLGRGIIVSMLGTGTFIITHGMIPPTPMFTICTTNALKEDYVHVACAKCLSSVICLGAGAELG